MQHFFLLTSKQDPLGIQIGRKKIDNSIIQNINFCWNHSLVEHMNAKKQTTSSTLSWSCSPAYSTLWKIFQVHLRRASRRAWHLLNQFWINIAERIAENITRKFERTIREESQLHEYQCK